MTSMILRLEVRGLILLCGCGQKPVRHTKLYSLLSFRPTLSSILVLLEPADFIGTGTQEWKPQEVQRWFDDADVLDMPLQLFRVLLQS